MPLPDVQNDGNMSRKCQPKYVTQVSCYAQKYNTVQLYDFN